MISQSVERAFERKLMELSQAADVQTEGQGTSAGKDDHPVAQQDTEPPIEDHDRPAAIASSDLSDALVFVDRTSSPGIDKSVLTIAEPRRYRSKEHLRFVATRACLVCPTRHLPRSCSTFPAPRSISAR